MYALIDIQFSSSSTSLTGWPYGPVTECPTRNLHEVVGPRRKQALRTVRSAPPRQLGILCGNRSIAREGEEKEEKTRAAVEPEGNEIICEKMCTVIDYADHYRLCVRQK